MGHADVAQVGSDIVGLTKLDYQRMQSQDSEPVTIGFPVAVGEILIANPNVKARRPNFKFYEFYVLENQAILEGATEAA